MNFLARKVTAVRVQERFSGEGASHRVGVVVLSVDAPF